MLCGQYILADKFSRNIAYLVERAVVSTFRFQFPSKRSFEKSKNTEDYLNLTLKLLHSDALFAIKISPLQCIICGQ